MQLLVDHSKAMKSSFSSPPESPSGTCRRSIFGDYWDNHHAQQRRRQVGPADSPLPPPSNSGKENSSFEVSPRESQSEPSSSPSMRMTTPKSILRRHHSDALHTTVPDLRSIFFGRRTKSDNSHNVVHFDSRVLVREFILSQEEEKMMEENDGGAERCWFTAAEIEQFKNEAIIEHIQKTIAAKKKRKGAAAETKDDDDDHEENPAGKDEEEKVVPKVTTKKPLKQKVCKKQLHPSFFFL